MADIYEKENDHENRAFVLDKAVELKPNDASLIFKVGYSYAESDYDELSLLHYKNAQDINPNDESVQNIPVKKAVNAAPTPSTPTT